MFRNPRPRYRFRMRRNDARDRLAVLLARQRQDRTVSRVAGLGTVTTGRAATSEARRQRTGAHLADRGDLAEQVRAALFQGGNLFIGQHRGPLSPTAIFTDSYRLRPRLRFTTLTDTSSFS